MCHRFSFGTKSRSAIIEGKTIVCADTRKILRLHGHRGYAAGIISSLNLSPLTPRLSPATPQRSFHPWLRATYRGSSRRGQTGKRKRWRTEVDEGHRSIDDDDPVDDSSLVIIRMDGRERKWLRKGEREIRERNKRRVRVLELEAIGRRHYSHRLRLPHGSMDLFFQPRAFLLFAPSCYFALFALRSSFSTPRILEVEQIRNWEKLSEMWKKSCSQRTAQNK